MSRELTANTVRPEHLLKGGNVRPLGWFGRRLEFRLFARPFPIDDEADGTLVMVYLSTSHPHLNIAVFQVLLDHEFLVKGWRAGNYDRSSRRYWWSNFTKLSARSFVRGL